MPFLTFSKVEIDFAKKKLIWKAYTTAEALATIKKVQIINPKKFIKAALDLEQKTFVIYVVTFFMK